MIRVNVYVHRQPDTSLDWEADVEGGESETIQVWIQEDEGAPFQQYEREPEPKESACGSCVAGVVLDHTKGIQRCDECKVFADDQDAAIALWEKWKGANRE